MVGMVTTFYLALRMGAALAINWTESVDPPTAPAALP